MEGFVKKFSLLFLVFILTLFNFVFCADTVLEKAKKHITEVEPTMASMLINTDKKIFILDVRSKSDYDKGHIKGAVLIPSNQVLGNIRENKVYEQINTGKVPDKKQAIIIYSSDGDDGLLAGYLLREKDYNFIFNIRGGFENWKKENLNYEKSKSIFGLF